MPIRLFDDDCVEIACSLCDTTSPRTIAWLHANDSYTCPACNSDVILDRDKQLAGLNQPTIR
jgi:hypothetical protein